MTAPRSAATRASCAAVSRRTPQLSQSAHRLAPATVATTHAHELPVQITGILPDTISMGIPAGTPHLVVSNICFNTHIAGTRENGLQLEPCTDVRRTDVHAIVGSSCTRRRFRVSLYRGRRVGRRRADAQLPSIHQRR